MFTLRYDDGELEAVGPSWSHATAARSAAKAFATDSGRPVAILAADKVRFSVQPDGSVNPPSGVLVPEGARCTRTEDRPFCFCVTCRAARTEQRARRPKMDAKF